MNPIAGMYSHFYTLNRLTFPYLLFHLIADGIGSQLPPLNLAYFLAKYYRLSE